MYRTSGAAAPRLRVGVVVERGAVPAFRAAIIDDIRSSTFAGLDLLVIAPELARPHSRRHLLHDLYTRLDERLSLAGDPLQFRDSADLLAGVPTVDLAPRNAEVGAASGALQAVRDARLDVLVQLCDRGVGGLSGCARYGVWRYAYGADRHRRSPLRSEVIAHDRLTEVSLRASVADQPEVTLCRSLFATEDALRASYNRVAPLWETTHFVIWKLRDLHTSGWESLLARAPAPVAAAQEVVDPSNARMVRWFAATGMRKAIPGLLRPVRDLRWKVAFRRASAPLCDPHTKTRARAASWVEAARGHSYADPFLLRHGDERHLFVEDIGEDGRGVISCAKLDARGEPGPMQQCLDTGGHLSYPMVFSHDGALWMIPESASSGEVALYRAERPVGPWRKEKVLFSGCRAVDTTVHHQDGTWWFFTTLSDRPKVAPPKLLLFYSDSLTGRWIEHPANPISADVRDARGGGAIFRYQGALIRPTQSCTPIYGYSVTLHEVLELTRTRYRDRPIRTIEPSWSRGLLRTHTYAYLDGLEVLDGCTWGYGWYAARPSPGTRRSGIST